MRTLVLGSLLVWLVVFTIVMGTSTFDEGIIKSTRVILEATQDEASSSLLEPKEQLFRLGDSLSRSETFMSDFSYYLSTIEGIKRIAGDDEVAMTPLSEQRLAGREARLKKTLQELTATRSSLSGVVLADASGSIVLSDSEVFPVAEKGALEKFSVLAEALKGEESYAVLFGKKRVYHGMAFVPLRSRTGDVQGLAVLVDTQAFRVGEASVKPLVMEGKVARFGKAPEGMTLPAKKSAAVFPLAPCCGGSNVLGMGEVGLPAVFVSENSLKMKAAEFTIPGNPGQRGFVTLAPRAEYAELGGIQHTIILLALLLWACGIAMLLTVSRSLLESGDAIADAIAAKLKGKTAVGVDGAEMAPEMARLNQLVGKLMDGQAPAGADSNSSAAAPADSEEVYVDEPGAVAFAGMDLVNEVELVNLDHLAFGPVSGEGVVVGAGGLVRSDGALVGDDFRAAEGMEQPAEAAEHQSESEALDASSLEASAEKLVPEMELSPAPMGEEMDVRMIYEKFLEIRRSHGEPELSFQKFLARLEQIETAVKTKHGCGDVRFEVRVKNGKAALKASPVN
ncbi:MAG: MXAN_5187 C-terminal domain-containing protein [Myxococcota bacterium]|nr:MXAN_5187 C-terminal domain-containing protein [Myxococcota bacterium]